MNCSSRKDLVIKGYVHPETINESTKQNIYKTFDSVNKNNQNYGISKTDNYATFETSCDCHNYDETGRVIHNGNCKGLAKQSYNFITEEKHPNTLGELCPICSEFPLFDCECEYKDFICKNRHHWYIKDNKVIAEDPHL